MKTLNLVDLEKSDIKYKKIPFPDGQQNVIIDYENIIEYYGCSECEFESYYPAIQIKSRLNNWLDLELIVCAVAALRELGVEEIHLYTPYIMGARSDRKFEEGGNNYLKDVICPIINSLNFKTVTCIDPHSDVLEACIKGFRKESNEELIKFAFENIPSMNGSMYKMKMENIILISPDAGASKKIYKLAEQIGYKGDIITCSKDRDTEGRLTQTVVPTERLNFLKKDLIIIDDICDGGKTFINIAIKIREQLNHYTPKIYLIVTHGIFSKGFNELSKYFDGIYCTNSYSNLPEWQEVKGKILTCNKYDDDFVKQLNVF